MGLIFKGFENLRIYIVSVLALFSFIIFAIATKSKESNFRLKVSYLLMRKKIDKAIRVIDSIDDSYIRWKCCLVFTNYIENIKDKNKSEEYISKYNKYVYY